MKKTIQPRAAAMILLPCLVAALRCAPGEIEGGLPGIAGTVGSSGAAGTTVAGVAGTTGAAGSVGSSGPSGAAGVSGAAGAGAAGTTGAAGSNAAGAAGTTGAAGTRGAAGATGAGGSSVPTAKFSFFVTSWQSLQDLSKSPNGFGGNLSYGETGPGAGLRGADKICAAIAQRSMPGAGAKPWRAFLSAVAGEDGKQVNAIDRIGNGPWYDRLGRTLALTKADLLFDRPRGADPAIANDFPNEDGVPNHAPDAGNQVDNHDFLTGTNKMGQLFSATSTCKDWTGATGTEGKPHCGHSWPRQGSGVNWMDALNESGCSPGASLVEMGGPKKDSTTVGSGGGYGGFYCFSLTP